MARTSKTTKTTDNAPTYLVIVRGKGTRNETRIYTTIPVYWCNRANTWVTIPD